MLTSSILGIPENFIRLPPLRLYKSNRHDHYRYSQYMQENTYFAISDLILNSDKLDPNTNTKHTDYEKTLH